MKRWKWTQGLVALALVCGCSLIGWKLVEGQDVRSLSELIRGEQSMSKMSGRVKEMLKTPRDEVDGFLLEDGSQIHFPPHMSERVVKLIATGDSVEVTGRTETLPKGERVFEASQISKGGETVTMEPPRRGPRPPHGPRSRRFSEEPMQANGVIQEFVTNPHGDIDGFLLKDGTEVKVPPHQGAELQSIIKAGDEVQIDGRRHVTPHGDIHLHADRIMTKSSGKVFERDDPESRRDGYAEIMKELHEIRRLLEVSSATK